MLRLSQELRVRRALSLSPSLQAHLKYRPRLVVPTERAYEVSRKVVGEVGRCSSQPPYRIEASACFPQRGKGRRIAAKQTLGECTMRIARWLT